MFLNYFKLRRGVSGQYWRSKRCLQSTMSTEEIGLSLKMLKVVRSFRNRGHFAASLDPLTSQVHSNQTLNGPYQRQRSWLPTDAKDHPDVVKTLKHYPELDLSPFNLRETDISETFYLANEIQSMAKQDYWKVGELIALLKQTYCGNVGIEFAHVENDVQRKWLEFKLEGELGPKKWQSKCQTEKIKNHKLLMEVDHTAQFLNEKFPSAKVFGIEGCESLILGLTALAETASNLGVEGLEIGMAHRGRMNVLHNFFQKPLQAICNRFSEVEPNALGDVKYHLGTRAELSFTGLDGIIRPLHLSLAANPSHLEAVNAVVIGKTKAKQFFVNDVARTRVMPVLLHGDAAFSGQGIVSEVMELSNLPDYTVGGCVHIVINNQIGFTTDPRSARTSYHCTNAAKVVGAPIFHVNGDDAEAVVAVCRLAVEWRQKFASDVVVDIVCYRRHGHNSLDDPSITLPLTYQAIDKHPTTLRLYEDQLIAQGIVTKEYCDYLSKSIWKDFDTEYENAKYYRPNTLDWLASNWQGAAMGSLLARRPYNQTGVRMETLKSVGESLLYVPPHITVHKDVEKMLKQRERALKSGRGITMAFAESLAFGCLMNKFSPESEPGLRGLTSDDRTIGNADQQRKNHSVLLSDLSLLEHPTVHVRLSGQDVIRGTFNQRHAAIYCQQTNECYWQLNNMKVGEQASISVCNSSLSEAAVLGFEYGYSLSNEMALTIWEAQFGDFSNVAQAIIDNFICSGESKWGNSSSLVLLLPHGYDGQGPEHSSARLERFLQLVDDDPDCIPGINEVSRSEMVAGYAALQEGRGGGRGAVVTKEALIKIMQTPFGGDKDKQLERVDVALAELLAELNAGGPSHVTDHEHGSDDASSKQTSSSHQLTEESWCRLMGSWLQNNAERKHNLIVVCPSTPAQYFHCLRRQIHRPYAKPLVVMSAKWLLHHKACASRLSDLATGTFFQRVIVEGAVGDNMTASQAATVTVTAGDVNVGSGDNAAASSGSTQLLPAHLIKRVIFCSGKIFYHLYHARAAVGARDITIVRLEQVAPFPYDLLSPVIARHSAAQLVWVQEEPKNMGAWSYVKPRFETALRELSSPSSSTLPRATSTSTPATLHYIGRSAAASSATGAYRVHVTEQKDIIDRALSFDHCKL